MLKNRIKIMTGVCALLLAVGLNMRHALNDYGVKSVNLNIEALARTTDEGNGVCQKCIDETTHYKGVIFFCVDGSGGCWDSKGCVSGACL